MHVTWQEGVTVPCVFAVLGMPIHEVWNVQPLAWFSWVSLGWIRILSKLFIGKYNENSCKRTM